MGWCLGQNHGTRWFQIAGPTSLPERLIDHVLKLMLYLLQYPAVLQYGI